MGLIKQVFDTVKGAAGSAIKGTLEDQFKEAIRCEDMGNNILMVKKTTPTGVITSDSTIIVAPGQCAIIYDNGRVIDATAEDGIYKFDSSSSPSFFGGKFKETFGEMWQRFTYGGASAKEQAVFFFNIKEIMENTFGTATPIPYSDWSHPIPNQMTNTITPLRVDIKCYGKYTFSIDNPALFMEKIAGVAAVYKKDQLVEQIRSEVLAVFQNVTNELGNSEHKVAVLELPSQTDEIKTMMNEKVFDQKLRERGLKIDSFLVESVSLDEASAKKIDDYELSSNAYMQQGKMVDAYSEAIKNAASNEAGAMNGFMGIGMMNMQTGNAVNNIVGGAWNNTDNSRVDLSKEGAATQEAAAPAPAADNTWTCECGTVNSGKFCSNCGKQKPGKKVCKKCGRELGENDKFCPDCGEKVED